MFSMPTRDLSREAHLWYTITSPEYMDRARDHLQLAYDWMVSDVKQSAYPLVADYPPVPHWGGVIDSLIQSFANARAMLQNGEYSQMVNWAGRLADVPRGMGEGITSWMAHADEFWRELEAASGVADCFVRAITMSNMFSGDAYKDGTADWRAENPRDIGRPSWFILNDEEFVLPSPQAQIPEYAAVQTVACKTGEVVPWTGVWVPSTGMGTAALAFVQQGQQIMQPAYEVARFDDEGLDVDEFELVDCTWHPVKPTGRQVSNPALPSSTIDASRLRCEAGRPCPREGYWFTPASPSSRRSFKYGEAMPEFTSGYGLTIWQWDDNQS